MSEEFTTKQELERMEMSFLNLSFVIKSQVDREGSIDGEHAKLIVQGLEAATSSIGAIASGLHAIDNLSEGEFELIVLALQDVREQAMEEVMAGDKDVSPVDFVDGILAKLRSDED